MMRLPLFEFRAPVSVSEAVLILDGEGRHAMPLAGGTDLLPNMKRRQQVPKTLMSLNRIAELRQARLTDSGSRLGACLTLSEIAADPRFRNGMGALAQAASFVATPQIRNMATLGGNLCLDTRCNYYDQNYEWRKAIGFCLKKDGDTCRSEEHTSELQSRVDLVCRLLLEKKKSIDESELMSSCGFL